MTTKNITVKIKSGHESRPEAVLVQVASQFDSRIYVESGTKKFNAKSIMGMMTLGLCEGEEIIVSAEGNDELEAVSEIEKYLNGSN